MRSSVVRTAAIWSVFAVVIAGVQLVAVTSASPFIAAADTNAWRQSEPIRLEGKAYALAVAVAPVVNFPLRQIILRPRPSDTSLTHHILLFVFLSAKDVATQHVTATRLDVTFALINTAIWLLMLGLAAYLVRLLRASQATKVSHSVKAAKSAV
jgi:hypothetical protein